jgi:hypothetical protein
MLFERIIQNINNFYKTICLIKKAQYENNEEDELYFDLQDAARTIDNDDDAVEDLLKISNLYKSAVELNKGFSSINIAIKNFKIKYLNILNNQIESALDAIQINLIKLSGNSKQLETYDDQATKNELFHYMKKNIEPQIEESEKEPSAFEIEKENEEVKWIPFTEGNRNDPNYNTGYNVKKQFELKDYEKFYNNKALILSEELKNFKGNERSLNEKYINSLKELSNAYKEYIEIENKVINTSAPEIISKLDLINTQIKNLKLDINKNPRRTAEEKKLFIANINWLKVLIQNKNELEKNTDKTIEKIKSIDPEIQSKFEYSKKKINDLTKLVDASYNNVRKYNHNLYSKNWTDKAINETDFNKKLLFQQKALLHETYASRDVGAHKVNMLRRHLIKMLESGSFISENTLENILKNIEDAKANIKTIEQIKKEEAIKHKMKIEKGKIEEYIPGLLAMIKNQLADKKSQIVRKLNNIDENDPALNIYKENVKKAKLDLESSSSEEERKIKINELNYTIKDLAEAIKNLKNNHPKIKQIVEFIKPLYDLRDYIKDLYNKKYLSDDDLVLDKNKPEIEKVIVICDSILESYNGREFDIGPSLITAKKIIQILKNKLSKQIIETQTSTEEEYNKANIRIKMLNKINKLSMDNKYLTDVDDYVNQLTKKLINDIPLDLDLLNQLKE